MSLAKPSKDKEERRRNEAPYRHPEPVAPPAPAWDKGLLAQAQALVTMAALGASKDLDPLQAQAQARLLQLPAFSMLLGPLASLHQAATAVSAPLALPITQAPTPPQVQPPKRPHHDPEKVARTIFVENVAEDVDEQVAFRCYSEYIAGERLPQPEMVVKPSRVVH